MPTARQVIDLLKLEPQKPEGGFSTLTYASNLTAPHRALPGFTGPRKLASEIYYFLDPTTFSAMHRTIGDMLYHFYLGEPVEVLLLHPNKASETLTFGNDLLAGQRPQLTVPGGTWMGSRLIRNAGFALMGVTLAPGYNPADYTLGERGELIDRYPADAALITALTRQ